MSAVTFVEANGTEHRVEIAEGLTLMAGALQDLVPGIEGDCGGMCACGTCHVYIPDAWTERCGSKSELETEILAFAYNVDERSRLACQIVVDDNLDGIRVGLPERQY